jgi:hypothetical protein
MAEFGELISYSEGTMRDLISSQLVVLNGSPSWSAAPDNYSSLQPIYLEADGTARLIYGYGQTIYAVIDARFEVTAPGVMRFDYFETSQMQGRPSFVPTDDNRSKEIGFSLAEGEWIFGEDVTGFAFRFSWTLVFTEPPYPDGLTLPERGS